MTRQVLPNPATSFGKRVRRRLREGYVVWFTTVTARGTPQPNPVWFWWEDGELLVYNRPDAHRVANVRVRPRVSVHFDGDGRGRDIVVLSGDARVDDAAPPPHLHPGYLAKYRSGMTRVSGSPEAFSEAYTVAVRVRVNRVRGF